MTPAFKKEPPVFKRELAIRDDLEMQRWDLGIDIVVSMMAKFRKNL